MKDDKSDVAERNVDPLGNALWQEVRPPRGLRKPHNDKRDRNGEPLFLSLNEFVKFSEGMLVLADQAPERLTASQLIFFVLTATADIAGKHPTFSSIKESVGDQINKSLHSTYKIFLSPSRVYPNGLGWLRQELSENDSRVKFLRLTGEGRRVMTRLLRALTVE